MIENTYNIPILTLLIFIPILGTVILGFTPRQHRQALRWVALGISGINFLISLTLLYGFDSGTHKMQFVENTAWIPGIGVSYILGIDGLSLLLVLLTTLISVIAILCSWSAIEEGVKGYMACMLIMQTGMIGVFTSLDLILFFLFWEIGLVPMYFLIGLWGGQ